jgi:sphingomyelin phosphodiesterase acid-like 3
LIAIRKVLGANVTTGFWLLLFAALPLVCHGAEKPANTIPALLVSDIHFDPFHDPAQAKKLGDAPMSQWRSVLSAPPSADQQQAFSSLQQACHSRGVDTPYALFHSALQAMKATLPGAKFITVSGDLIAHAFFCRYSTLFPGATQSNYQAFVLKTASFVASELRAEFPDIPIYVALGNNDTPCDDYRLDAGSEFLAQAGKILAESLPPSQQPRVTQEFAKGGYYSVLMPEPMRETRLIVINDLFLSPQYATCAGRPDAAAATAELAWLQEQFAQARRLGQRAWVMGHIPPGVDPYSTVAKGKDICGNASPIMFLSTDKLADLLLRNADLIRLGIFAHSHMDEIRLLEPEHGAKHTAVAIKMVSSISPVDGNDPSFTVARVDPSTGLLEDYEVISTSDQTGIAATWRTEYDFGKTFQQEQFSSPSLRKLIDEFTQDPDAKTKLSQAYIRNFYPGDRSSQLTPFWPQYLCALPNHTAKGFTSCVCAGGK